MATYWHQHPPEEDLTRPTLIRRFTEELEPESSLAIQTKLYQDTLDEQQKARDKRRMDGIYYAPIETGSPFNGVDTARQSLQYLCEEYFEVAAQKEREKGTKRFQIRHHRPSREHKIASEVRGHDLYTVDDVNHLVSQLEDRWKRSNSKMVTYFNRICQNLDAHKAIFACFPSQSSYTSALCGAVTMIVQASINYSSIPDKLSGYTAELSDSISVCTRWGQLFHSRDIQTRLSTIYKQFFDFFIKVATYYLKPKFSQWLDAFNSSLADEYQRAADTIRTSIDLINREAQLRVAGEVKAIIPQLDLSIASQGDRIIEEVRRNRIEYTQSTAAVGKEMFNLLLENLKQNQEQLQQMQRQIDEVRQEPWKSGQLEGIPTSQAVFLPEQGIPRAKAEEDIDSYLQSLVRRAGGSDGIKWAMDSGPLLATPIMMEKLGEWLEVSSSSSEVLWIMGSYELGEQTSARSAALGMIRAAVQTKAQFLSYVCEQSPTQGGDFSISDPDVGDDTKVHAMICSLVRQLLQFRPPEDTVQIAPELLKRTTGGDWHTALELLNYLLQNTPALRYCIIADVNCLEGDAESMCREFIQMLCSHTSTSRTDCPLRVLFTTSGQSAVLPECVPMESTIAVSGSYHRLRRRGQVQEIDLFLEPDREHEREWDD
ncbi:hypothetical protein BO71DRAFT_439210 [Aspergillus ellipticus CBS 707.79]|uniref:DUF7708 domain-containing protein n=1 Tax=Aspergillus ellipticus CBS 707.79 TaxID=1448320 RepID=A0A319E8D6_9EURO|nr:hypothetical protein BO71DRAFT_439210 [Aspergillus ellipticus CBS 707.79]